MNVRTVGELERLPKPDEAAIDAALSAEIAANSCKIIVLDDDPTGTQTVHDVPVFTSWDGESIRAGLERPEKVFYVLTNSRSMTSDESERVHREIGEAIVRAREASGRDFIVLSRSDSTLRGHYPLETDTLSEVLGRGCSRVDGVIMCPFFKEGGRFTIEGTHYAASDGALVPASETEFARDRVFGYKNSYLPLYIEEKTGGRIRPSDVIVIGLELLRTGDIDAVERELLSATSGAVLCVDAADYIDLKVFAAALYRAYAKGRRFIFRTAAGLVPVLGGIAPRPLLERCDMRRGSSSSGGLVIVGSHTRKTTDQLERLLTLKGTSPVEFDSDLVLDGEEVLSRETERAARAASAVMESGRTAVCFTKRQLLSMPDDTEEAALARGAMISRALTDVAAAVETVPAFIVAKGGITSSDTATRALGIRRATVLGQIVPGVPVWSAGSESRYPGMSYVIFPGNTGGPESLLQAVSKLI